MTTLEELARQTLDKVLDYALRPYGRERGREAILDALKQVGQEANGRADTHTALEIAYRKLENDRDALRAEIARLKARNPGEPLLSAVERANERLAAKLAEYQQGASVEAQLGDEARAELASLRADKDDLDWLDRHRWEVLWGAHQHVRAAIRAARASQPEDKL